MIKYRFAFNEEGATICANDIAGRPVVDKFSCVGCGDPLIAKVNGEKHRPHFAHKTQIECSGETYLHKLGKAAFVETYKKCLADGEPFKIRLKSVKTCTKFYPAIMTGCSLGEVEKEYDLTDYYHHIEVEKRDGQFIPDVMLVHKTKPDEVIYIEIACTHFLSEEKERSQKRIIEIPIESEEDIGKIRKASLSATDALFIGFKRETHAITDSDCVCASKKCYAFFVFESGKAKLELSELAVVHARAQKRGVIYANFHIPHDGDRTTPFENHAEGGGGLFIDQVRLAAARSVPIKNCYLCRHFSASYDAFKGKPVYCMAFRKTCGSNDAAECAWYQTKDA